MTETPRDSKKPNDQKPKFRFSFGYIVLILLGITIFNTFLPSQRPDSVPYSQFKTQVKQGAFEKVWLTSQFVVGDLKGDSSVTDAEGKKALFSGAKTISSRRPTEDRALLELLDETGVPYEVRVENTAFRDFLLTWILPLGLMFLLWSFLFKRMGPGTEVLKFGKNKSHSLSGYAT